MSKKLLMSVSSLVTVLAVGVGATYALFTSNPVTISETTVNTGDATIKLCNATGANNWRNSISGFTVDGLVPDGPEKEVTLGASVYVGNDHGGFATAVDGGATCGAYFDTAGTSNVDMKMVPSV